MNGGCWRSKQTCPLMDFCLSEVYQIKVGLCALLFFWANIHKLSTSAQLSVSCEVLGLIMSQNGNIVEKLIFILERLFLYPATFLNYYLKVNCVWQLLVKNFTQVIKETWLSEFYLPFSLRISKKFNHLNLHKMIKLFSTVTWKYYWQE